MTFREVINQELSSRGWSRKKLSEISGVPESTLSLKLAPQRFDTDQIQKIATAFGWTASELMRRAEESEVHTL